MNRKAAFPSKFPGGWRVQPGATVGLGLAALLLGCSEDPHAMITGKSVALIPDYYIVEQPFTLDTGGDGSQSIQTDDTWEARCDVSIPGSPWMKITRKDHSTISINEYIVSIMYLRVRPESSGELSIGAMVERDGGYYLMGTCPVTFERTNDDPAAGTFSASRCDLETKDGEKGRLDFARFHGTYCNTEPRE